MGKVTARGTGTTTTTTTPTTTTTTATPCAEIPFFSLPVTCEAIGDACAPGFTTVNGGTGESLAVSENRDCSLEDVTARFCPDTASGLRLRVHLHAGLQSAYRLCYHALP